MKYRVIHDFRGSQDGCTVTEFRAGDVSEISQHLAPHVGAWAVPADEAPIQNKAVITDGAPRKPRVVTSRPPAQQPLEV